MLAKSIDNDGKFTFTDARVIEVVDNPVGINEIEKNIDFQVFPIPANDVLHLVISNMENPLGAIEIMDVLGELQTTIPVNNSHMELPVNQLNAGVYFLQLKLENGRKMVRKFIVNR